MPYLFWEVLRSVIGAGVDRFVYNPPHVRTPVAQRSNRKTTTDRRQEPQKTNISEGKGYGTGGGGQGRGAALGKEDQKLPAAPTASSEEVEERDAGKERKEKRYM